MKNRKKKPYISFIQQKLHTQFKPLSVQPKAIQLKGLEISGFAMGNAKAGEKVRVIFRGGITSDEREFHQYMEEIGNLICSRASDEGIIISFDSLHGFLLVIHQDNSGELYLDKTGMTIEILTKRSLNAGDAVYRKDIADIRRIRYPKIVLSPSDKIVACFKVGWKFGLFFDLGENRDLSIDQSERYMGALYRRLRYQGIYEAIADLATVERMIKAGWFPFIEIIGGDFEPLLKAYRTDFEIESRENILVNSFGSDRIDLMAERWWNNPIIAKHQTVLQAGLNTFKNGDYISCIKNLMTEIEGVLVDLHLAEKGSSAKTEQLLRHAVDKGVKKSGDEASLFLPNDFLQYLIKVVYANFDPIAPQKTGVSRHTVGHGRASGEAYTSARALQVILTLDQLAFYL